MDIWLVCCGSIRRLIIFSLQILDEMHLTYEGGGGGLTDGIRTVDCVYDPFKRYGWTHQHVTAFTIRTNLTDRQTAMTPSLE